MDDRVLHLLRSHAFHQVLGSPLYRGQDQQGMPGEGLYSISDDPTGQLPKTTWPSLFDVKQFQLVKVFQ